MPELPEVETIRRQLESALVGLVVSHVELRRSDVVHGEPQKIHNKRILGVRRFSKLLVVDFDGSVSIAIHLKMTGQLILSKSKAQMTNDKTGYKSQITNPKFQTIPKSKKNPKNSSTKISEGVGSDELNGWDVEYATDKHTHVVVHFVSGEVLYFNDQRRFGYIKVVPTGEVASLQYILNLGPEFLRTISLKQFCTKLFKSQKPIKQLLLDQSKFAGVGNIYACESLWRAQIDPRKIASKIAKEQAQKLYISIEEVLREAIDRHGASRQNFRDIYGQKGDVQNYFAVYEQEGKSCGRCGTRIEKFALAGRGTYSCPTCQS